MAEEPTQGHQSLPRYRAKWRDAFSPRFNGYLYFALINAVGLSAMGFGVWMLRSPEGWDWLAVPEAFLLVNVFEWVLHRGPMHRKRFYGKRLYKDHALMHHQYFPNWDFAAPSHREWGFVLIPAWALVLIVAGTLPLTYLAATTLHWDRAWLFFVTAIGYYLLYEWLHLTYHLPEEHPVGGLAPIRFLRRHHRTHHDPALMRSYNFNVTFPIADYLFGTAFREKKESGKNSG